MKVFAFRRVGFEVHSKEMTFSLSRIKKETWDTDAKKGVRK